MLRHFTSVAIVGILASAIAVPGRADTISYAAVTSTAQIAIPSGMEVVKAVNIGTSSANTVNEITFEADSATAPHNGYTQSGTYFFDQASAGIAGADFTKKAVNIAGTGNLEGNPIALVANSDYVFDVYLVNKEATRSTQISYSLGGGAPVWSGVLVHNDEVNRYRVEFNSGSATSFTWHVGKQNTGGYHSYVAGIALFAAPVPEPKTSHLIVMGLVGGLVCYGWRTRK